MVSTSLTVAPNPRLSSKRRTKAVGSTAATRVVQVVPAPDVEDQYGQLRIVL